VCLVHSGVAAILLFVIMVTETENIRTAEHRRHSEHLSRLREGVSESVKASTVHQHTLCILKQANTSFAMAGYLLLDGASDLLSCRLSAQE